MTKIRPIPIVIGLLLFMIVFTQVTGHLSLTNGVIENIFRLMEGGENAGSLMNERYLYFVVGNIFDLIHRMGATQMAYYIYPFNFIFAVMPLLPLPYYIWKRKKADHVIILPLIIASLVYSLLDLHLFSEYVFGISAFLILIAGIHYSQDPQSHLEKAFLISISTLSFLGGLGLMWFAPLIFFFSWQISSEQNKKFLLLLCTGVAMALLYNLYLGIIEPLNIRLFWITLDAKFNLKLLSFGLLFHLAVFLVVLLRGHIVQKHKQAIYGSALIGLTLLWLDWTIFLYLNQKYQNANVLSVTILSGGIAFIGFRNAAKLNINTVYPLLAVALFGTFWLQSHHKMRNMSSLNQLYDHCSAQAPTNFGKEVFIRHSYDYLHLTPYLSLTACLLKDVKPNYVLGSNLETIEFGRLKEINVTIPKYLKYLLRSP